MCVSRGVGYRAGGRSGEVNGSGGVTLLCLSMCALSSVHENGGATTCRECAGGPDPRDSGGPPRTGTPL